MKFLLSLLIRLPSIFLFQMVLKKQSYEVFIRFRITQLCYLVPNNLIQYIIKLGTCRILLILFIFKKYNLYVIKILSKLLHDGLKICYMAFDLIVKILVKTQTGNIITSPAFRKSQINSPTQKSLFSYVVVARKQTTQHSLGKIDPVMYRKLIMLF